jgi:hypothetical protein
VIIEGVATTWDATGVVNVAPLGPIVPDSPPTEWTELLFRPFPGSRTYANLKATREGVFHLTDDVMLIAKSAIGEANALQVPCHVLEGRRLVDFCRALEFRIVDWHEASERPEAIAEIVYQTEGRSWSGFNRARHAVIEAAILATRLHLLGKATVQLEFERLKTPVEKTTAPSEAPALAFALLQDYVQRWSES